jgi:hypothetical protein
MIAKAHEKFDANGNLTDETAKKLIQQLLQNLVDWTGAWGNEHRAAILRIQSLISFPNFFIPNFCFSG